MNSGATRLLPPRIASSEMSNIALFSFRQNPRGRRRRIRFSPERESLISCALCLCGIPRRRSWPRSLTPAAALCTRRWSCCPGRGECTWIHNELIPLRTPHYPCTPRARLLCNSVPRNKRVGIDLQTPDIYRIQKRNSQRLLFRSSSNIRSTCCWTAKLPS